MRSNPESWVPLTQHTALFYAYEQVVNRRNSKRRRSQRSLRKTRGAAAVESGNPD